MSAGTFPVVTAATWDPPVDGAAPGAFPTRGMRARWAVPTALLLGDAAAVLVSVLVTAFLLPPHLGDLGPLAAAAVAWSAVLGVLVVRGSYSRARRLLAPRVADDMGTLAVG
ncbi:MAG TPA: hypothetical protein VMB82_07365, partial [Acidimicrobiales bacterium]|nr:hypothetical protein [Acidimicrobiales bacterium]